MKKEILFGIAGLFIGIVLVSFMGPSRFTGSMMNRDRNDSFQNEGLRGRMSTTLDQHFIEQMIPHHEGAVSMATLALSKSTHPEIKELASNIIKAQNKEILDMRSWYQDWFGTNVLPQSSSTAGGGSMMSSSGMHMGGQQNMETLASARDFDKAFIEEMIPHHQLAIMMAQMLKAGTTRPEMKTLANAIIDSQSKEITQMQTWYKAWYK